MNRKNFLKLFAGLPFLVAALPSLATQTVAKVLVKTPRKLKAVWTIEAEQDLMAFHSIDAEQTITEMMNKQIQNDIDQEFINKLDKLAI